MKKLLATFVFTSCLIACGNENEHCFGEGCGMQAPVQDSGTACSDACMSCVVDFCNASCMNNQMQGVCFESCKTGPTPDVCLTR